MTQLKTSTKICPYWSSRENRCSSCNNGIFIPLDSHISTYCNSDRHTECLQFKTEYPQQKRKASSTWQNRRKFTRIAAREKIFLNKFSLTGKPGLHGHKIADIVDLSAGGMKIHLQEPLFYDATLQFCFENEEETTAAASLGTVRVRWCSYNEQNLGYDAGLAFDDEHTRKNVNERIPLPVQ